MTATLPFAGPRRVASIAAMVALTAMLGVTAAHAQVATPFDCPPDGILVQSATGNPSQVRFVDMASGTEAPGPTLSTLVNGIGYNTLDDLVYGIDMTNGGLIRFGANGALEPLTTPPQLNTTSPIGDVDENGHYWTILRGNEWMQIDLTADPPAFVDSGPVSGGGIGGFANLLDWSYVPGTNSLYAVARQGTSQATLFRFHRDSKLFEAVAPLGDLGAPNAFGATYADPDGFLYASNNGTGVIWQIDVRSGARGQFAQGQSASNNDGARCFTAQIPVDFGDAPDSYGTLVASAGARHSVLGFTTDSNTAPLMLGSNVSIEPQGQPTADADADTFEDGVAEPITMVIGEPPTIDVSVTNNGSDQATLVGWIDVDHSGTFDAGDRSNVRTIPATSGTQTYELTFPAVSAADDTYARFRVYSGEVDDPSPVGEARGGGVEDHLVQVIDEPAITLAKSADTDELAAGNTITYTFEATNTGDEPLDDVVITDTAFSGAGELSELECDQPTSLDPSQTLMCTATYEVQQADVDSGSIENEADVVGTGRFSGAAVGDQASAHVSSVFAPGLELSKSASPARVAVGDTITYTFEATNTGNVTLSGVEITDTEFSGAGSLSDLSCNQDQPATLAPGDTLECTATYTVQQADAVAGGITNVATVTGNAPGGGSVTGRDGTSVSVTPPAAERGELARTGLNLPSMALLVTAFLASGGLVIGFRRPHGGLPLQFARAAQATDLRIHRDKETDMAENSFDVVAEVDRQEVDNAINQAAKEVAQRYDFKNTGASIAWSGDSIAISANSEERVMAALDVLKSRLVKRKVSLKALEHGEPKPGSRGAYRLDISLVNGIPTDKAKAMVKQIKASKLKVTPAIQGDQLRISSKSKDALQEVQELLRANDQDLPLRFTNYK